MSKVCSLCGKRPVAGNNVSHSKRRTKRRFNPNLISKKFGGVKIQICTSCLRTLKKPERAKKVEEAPKVETEIKKVEEKKEEKKPAKKAAAKK
jgi:large subunit ribosomal protein L28